MSLRTLFGIRAVFFAVVLLIGARYGTPLKCYICESQENDACTSTLRGLEVQSCSLVSPTDPSPSIPTSTTASSWTTESTDSSSAEPSTTTSDDLVTSSSSTEGGSTSTESSSTSSESSSTSASDESTVADFASLIQDAPNRNFIIRPSARSILLTRDGDDDNENSNVACYRIVYSENGADVTSRGCASANKTCSAIDPVKSCTVCNDSDGCNSTPSIGHGLTSVAVPLAAIFLLTR